MASKLIAIVGLTGNQGASVAETFLNLAGWKVRGITRDPSKPASQKWTERGVEVVAGDLDDTESLKKAFSGANVVFGVTDFWQHIMNPENHKLAAEQGREPNYVAYDRELEQGKNLVDAVAANVETLDRFVLSSLSDAKKFSKGKITFNLHFDSKAATAEYLKEKYPELWKKSSLLTLGSFAGNWRQGGAPEKQADGSYKVSVPMGGDAKIPIVDVNADTGNFVKALVDAAPQKTLVGAGSYLTWNEWVDIFSKVHNVKTTFERQDRKIMEDAMGPFGREMADMFEYIDEFGYDGRDPEAIYPWDLKKEGIDVKYTTVEEYIKKTDWSSIL